MDDAVTSVDTSVGTGMGVFEVTPKSRALNIGVALTSTGACTVIGAVFWGESGVIAYSSQEGGSLMSQQLASLSGGAFKQAYAEFFAAMNTKLVIDAQRVETGTEVNYPTFWNAYQAMGASVLVVSEPPRKSGTAGVALTILVNDYLRAQTRALGIPFVDQARLINSYAEIEALGWDVNVLSPFTVDLNHLGGLHYRWLAGLILQDVNFFHSAFSRVGSPESLLVRRSRSMLEQGIDDARTFRIMFHGRTLQGITQDGADYTATIDDERGARFRCGGTVVGRTAARLGTVSPSTYIRTNLHSVACAWKSYRGPNMLAGLRAFIAFGCGTTTLQNLNSIPSRGFGVEFAKASDLPGGTVEGGVDDAVRIWSTDGTTKTNGSWGRLRAGGETSLSTVGMTMVLIWNLELQTLFLFGSGGESLSANNMRMLASLHAPDLAANAAAGHWAHAGIWVPDADNIPAATNPAFSILELTVRHAAFGDSLGAVHS
jgi:hypothetical protein